MNTSPSDEEIDATIAFLTSMYPNLTPPNLVTFGRLLQERGETGAILYAAESWYAEPRYKPQNKFWPTPADLLEIAEAQGVKKINPAEWNQALALDLAERLQGLEDLFYQKGVLDERAWQALEAEYKKRNRPAGVENVRTRLAHKKALQNGTYARKFTPDKVREIANESWTEAL